MSSALSVRSAMLPRVNAIGKHHRFGGDHAAAAAGELGLAERGVRQPEQVPDLVQRDRLDVVAIRPAGLGRRPREDRVEEDVRLEDAPVGLVDGERGRGERPILVRAADESDHVRAIVDERERPHEADELSTRSGRSRRRARC